MELSAATLELLQDEAYAYLCRQAVQEKLAAIEREKEAIAVTRPPFGMLARKETRDAFTRSMRTALDNEAALRERLSQIVAIEEWLKPRLRNDISTYLAHVSPDCVRSSQIRARLEDWEQSFLALPELLVAFARDVRGARQAAAGGAAARPQYLHALAVLREIAVRVEQQHNELAVIAGVINERAQPGLGEEIHLPALPDLQRIAWVGRLALLTPEQAVAELTRVENEIRAFLAAGNDPVIARLEAAGDVCRRFEANALEQYWEQLRAHARLHYVEERDIDDVLKMLSQRYVSADLARRQKALSSNPFLGER